LTCDPLQRFAEKISEEFHEDFIELVHNSAIKSGLKSFPFDVLCPVKMAQVMKAQM